MMSIMLSFIVVLMILIIFILVGVPFVALIITIVETYMDFIDDKIIDFQIWLEERLRK